MRVYRSAECGSDHFPLKASLEIKYREQSLVHTDEISGHNTQNIKYNLDRLKQHCVSILYKMRIANKLQRIRGEIAKELYTDIIECKLLEQIRQAEGRTESYG